MDRLYRWKTMVGGGKNEMRHIQEFGDLPISDDAHCDRCNAPATHIQGNYGREEYRCMSCNEEQGINLMCYRLSFEEVKKLDSIECPNMIPYTLAEAINIYQMNKDLYTKEESKYSTLRIWLVVIDARVSKAMFGTLSISDATEKFRLTLSEEEVTRRWTNGECFVLFGEPGGRIVHTTYLARPSKL